MWAIKDGDIGLGFLLLPCWWGEVKDHVMSIPAVRPPLAESQLPTSKWLKWKQTPFP